MVCIDSSWHNIFSVHNTETFIAGDETGQIASFTKRPEAIQSDFHCPPLWSSKYSDMVYAKDNIQIENK